MSASAEKELVVTRTVEKGANVETSVTFTPTVFARGDKNKLGIKYPGFPVVTNETIQIARDFFGDENFLSMLNENIRQWMQQVYNAVIAQTGGVFDEKMFVDFVSELSTRGESKDEIEKAQADLRAQIIALYGEVEQTDDPEALLAFKGRLGAISKEIKKYDAILASKKRVPRTPKTEQEEEAA